MLDSLLRHEGRVDRVAHAAELLRLGHRAGARDHDLAELQRIRSEREVLLDDAGAQRDLHRGRLVTQPPRDDAERLARGGARTRDHNRIAAVIPGARSETE